jgi:tetratricopeptide (TPR) repeat protein
MAVPLLGSIDAGMADQPSRVIGAAQAAGEADSSALLLSIEATTQDRWRAGDLTRVAALRRQALRIALAAFGPEAQATVQAVTALALAYIDCRLWLDAETRLTVAARLLPASQDDRLRAEIFAGLARVALARGDIEAALAWAGRAVASARRDRLPVSAEPLRALGAAFAARERFEEARQTLDEALALDQRQHGPEAVETARSLSQLGNLYLRWGRPDDALPPLQEAAAIDQRRLGPAHPFIADDLHDLGLTYEALNRPERARALFLAALAVLERGPGSETSSETSRDTTRAAYTELALSRVEHRLGHAAAAEAAFRDARRILDAAEADERRRERRA